jgi:tetratricopeptide (TPR) repeat protein/DNA-binding CsgD family transcriptional regulator
VDLNKNKIFIILNKIIFWIIDMNDFAPSLSDSKDTNRILHLSPFTPREIDIIACLIHGRAPKKIAALLSLSSKTIENHIHNMMFKAECNSREGLLNYVEKAGYVPLLRQHYGHLNPLAFSEEQKEIRQSLVSPQMPTKNKRIISIISLTSFLILIGSGVILSLQLWTKKTMEFTARSDLSLPTKHVRLDRPELTSQIDDNFKGQGGIQTVALVGIGGAGKTTLARQYAHSQQASVIWEVDGKTFESLKESFENLAQALTKTEEDQKALRELKEIKNLIEREENLIKFVKDRLKLCEHWFLIYDNIENFDRIQKYFPQDSSTWGQGKVILTTRDNNIQNHMLVNNIVKIGELNTDQKFNLFVKIMSGENTPLTVNQHTEAKRFLENIPPFPLDISVAAYYLKTTNISYEQYIENLMKYNKDFTHMQESLLKDAGDYTHTRYKIIISSLEHLINIDKNFGELLLFISLLDPQHIPRTMLNNYKNEIIVDNFIHHLKKYSLITNESSSSIGLTFSVHHSTQAISLAYLIKVLELEKNKQFILPVVISLENYINNIADKEDISKMKPLVTHCKIFLSHNNLLTKTSRGFMNSGLGVIFYYLGNEKTSKYFLEEGLSSLKKSNTHNLQQIALTLGYLGNIYQGLGNYKKAKNLLEDSLTLYNKYFPAHYIRIAWTLGALGNVHRKLGEYKQAKSLLEESLTLYNKYSSNTQAIFARTLANLGLVYRALGEFKKAKTLLTKSIVIYEKYFPDNHDHDTWIMAYLGDVYKELGNYKKAKRLLEKSLFNHKKYFPEKHIKTAWFLVYLGSVYCEFGNYKKAKNLFEQSLNIYKNYQPEHAEMAWVLAYLGNVYGMLKNYEKAKITLENTLTIYKTLYPDNHVSVARALGFLGIVYMKLNDYKKAKNLLEKNLIIYQNNYGKNHIKVARILCNLGKIFLLEDRLERAEGFFYSALNIFQKNESPDIYLVLEDLAEVTLKKSTFEKNKGDVQKTQNFKIQAISYLNQAIEVVRTHFSEHSPHIARIQSKIKSISE